MRSKGCHGIYGERTRGDDSCYHVEPPGDGDPERSIHQQ